MTEMKDYFVAAEGIYLLNHSVGRMPKSARAHVENAFFQSWEHGSPDPWGHWLDAIGQFNIALARLLNGEPADFCPQPNLSAGLTKVLGALPPAGKRRVILLSENAFPSMGFVAAHAAGQDYELRFLPRELDVLDPEVWAQALTDDVAVVLMTHVHYNTSRRIPVELISRMAQERGIMSIVDIAQSAGVVPINLAEWQADVVIGSCVKWLCGGPGAGFLWVNKDIAPRLEPTDVGWFSHRNPMEFDIHNFEFSEGAARFWGGTPSVLPFALAANSIALICDIGVDVISDHNRMLNRSIIEKIDPECLVSPADDARRGGTLVLRFQDQQKVEAALQEAGVRFDVRPLGLRLSAHIYNTPAEIDIVKSCLAP